MIDLNKSFIECYGFKEGTNISIKSILKTNNNNIFLTKECRAEVNTAKPFSDNNGRYEYVAIFDDNKMYTVRDGNFSYKSENKHNKHLVYSNIKFLSFQEVLKITSSNISNNIFCQIKYNHQNVDYELIFKCEMINYSTRDNDYKYLQPTYGYVPFIDNNQVNYGYLAVHDNEKKTGNLEYVLKEQSFIFSTKPIKIFLQLHNNALKLIKIKSQNLIKLSIKHILNRLLFFKKNNNFTKTISIAEFKIGYFRYVEDE